MRLNYKVKTAKKNKFYSARFHYLHISVNSSYLLNYYNLGIAIDSCNL